MFTKNPKKYPIYRLPTSLRLAACEVADIVKCTDVIAVGAILNAANHAVCSNADWLHPGTGNAHSSALYSITTGLSGDRKTTADKFAGGPMYALDCKSILEHAEKIEVFKTARTAWSAIYAGLLSRVRKLARASEDTTDALAEVQAHAALAPEEPRLQRLIRQDVTHRAVFEALEGESRSVAFMVDEGQILFDSNVMHHLGVLNKLWDGAELLTYDRAKHDSIIVRNPRVSISIMVQPAILSKFLAKHGAIAHGSGHFARYLFARSPSIQGFREPVASSPALIDLLPFHSRLTELLQRYLDKTRAAPIQRDLLEFDRDAKELWFEIASGVEADIRPGRYLSDIGDFASKFMDMVGRVAATFHYFEDLPGHISEDTLKRAAELVAWHLDEYKAIFSPDCQRSPANIDAETLYSYLYRNYYKRDCMTVSKNFIRKHGGVRGQRYNPAIDELVSMSAIATWPGHRNTEMIELNGGFFYDNPL